MATADYVDLVLRGVGVETDLTAVAAQLAQARTAIDYYAPRADRPALADRFTAGLVRLLKDAEPGSDHQLAIARALALSINDAVGADVLKAWLAGEEVPEGLAVDADLRWRLLTELARVGAIGEAEIAAEADRDRTATGAEKAAGARAARKDADAKADAWAAATERETPNETHFQVCTQFWQVDQDAELAPYADRYLEVVDAIGTGQGQWPTTSTTIRQHVLGLLFPRPLADRAFIDKLDAFLAGKDYPDSVKRLVAERRDDAVRALNNQER
jgi:aminopeptidase N